MSAESRNLESNKKIVREFYDLAFNQRNPKEAADKYVGATYTQHNPTVGDGAQAFVDGITGWLATMPQLKVDTKRSIAEGNLVALHSHFQPAPGQRGFAVIDIFRLENGKIVEHWDVLQEIPEKIPHNNTMF